MSRPFSQVDVFAPGPRPGNPVAVVHDADELTTEQMQTFANWTNLSETTFLLRPAQPEADYRLRIFTPSGELPFAGHPTLGSAHAWLERGGVPRDAGTLVQECEAGLVRLRRAEVLSFAAPPLRRSGPVEADVLKQAVASLGVDPDRVLGANWVDNGPGWLAVRLASADDVLALRPDFTAMGALAVGVAGAHPAGGPADFEVRAFAPGHGSAEDPVTGSVNAGIAQWFLRDGIVTGGYTVRQGTALGRDGHLTIAPEGDTIWVGGTCRTVISGTVSL